MKKVLITGAGGQVGLALLKGLKASGKYDVVATSRRADEENGIGRLDVRDPDACREAFRGVDVVVHCAFYMKDRFRERFESEQVPSNIVGGYNVYEAALSNGVGRVIFTSSNHTVGFYKVDEKVDENSPMRPDSFYGLNKCFNELMGRYYSDRYNLSGINLRIGHLNAEDRPRSLRTARIFLSHRDLVQAVECSIDANGALKFATLFITSKNTGAYWDLAPAKNIIGYDPRDDGVSLIGREVAGRAVDRDDTGYMGGVNVSL